jgi:hypothetical protein
MDILTDGYLLGTVKPLITDTQYYGHPGITDDFLKNGHFLFFVYVVNNSLIRTPRYSGITDNGRSTKLILMHILDPLLRTIESGNVPLFDCFTTSVYDIGLRHTTD